MAEKAPLPRSKSFRITDLRGLVQLATQATHGVIGIAEGVHRSVWNTMRIPAGPKPERTNGITGLVYRSIDGATNLVGKGVDSLLTGLESRCETSKNEDRDSPRRDRSLALLNGLLGDRLKAGNNPLATEMGLRFAGENLHWDKMPPKAEVTGKVLVLIHGLCMADLHSHGLRKGYVDHGTALAAEHSYSAVYLRYNSGLHISKNGQHLSEILEQLVSKWPVPVEELSIIAYSMGGLIARSAYHYADPKTQQWPDLLKNIVFLGTPHHGAPLERAGQRLHGFLESLPFISHFAKVGRLRSSGITDLRHGHLLDKDWEGKDRFHRKVADHEALPLPESVECHTIAAVRASKFDRLTSHFIGDGLVPLHSALGHHEEPHRHLWFEEASSWIGYGMHHLDLLSSIEVTDQIRQWLAPKKKKSKA